MCLTLTLVNIELKTSIYQNKFSLRESTIVQLYVLYIYLIIPKRTILCLLHTDIDIDIMMTCLYAIAKHTAKPPKKNKPLNTFYIFGRCLAPI